MRLAALYSCFNGLELLEGSIEQIYPHVDDIILCYQTVSNKGEENSKVEPFIRTFEGKPKFHILKFKPHGNLNTKENEKLKLQMRIDYGNIIGCSHFFSSAEDHYYKPDEFEKAKQIINNYNYDISFTAMYTYYKYATWQLDPIEDYYMPFICRLYPYTKVKQTSNYPLRVDPSIQINTCDSWYLFDQSEIMLHHYSMIRNDVASKFRNAGASMRWKPGSVERFKDQYDNYNIQDNPGVDYFGGRKIIIKEDWAGID